MAARPVVAAFSCLPCRAALPRALTSASTLVLRARPPFPQPSKKLFPARTLTTDASDGPPLRDNVRQGPIAIENDDTELPGQTNATEETVGEQPWYLQVEPPRLPPRHEISPLPEIPESAPDMLEPLMKYVYEQMGLDDLSLLDLRALDPPSGLGPNLIMLLGTARSERHLHVATSRFVHWLRRELGVAPDADGLLLPGELKIKLRRLRRKAKLLGASGATTSSLRSGGDDGITTGWICVNLGTIGEEAGETASFEDGGKVSGFGTELRGTSIVVQVMTQKRRDELDLETLWAGALKQSKANAKKIKQSAEKRLIAEQSSASSTQESLPPTKPAALRASLSQVRSFTTMRQMSAAPEVDGAAEGIPVEESPADRFARVSKIVDDIRLSGLDASDEDFSILLRAIFQIPCATDDQAHRHAELATAVVQTMHERGRLSLDTELLVAVIESILRSNSSAPEMRAVQSNMERLLLKANVPCPSEPQLVRLMDAYASARDWDSLWRAWRVPPRFLVRRSPELYAFVLERAAATADRRLCVDALRNCFQEMLHEEPPVHPRGRLAEAVRSCIRIADPGAPAAARAPLDGGGGDGGSKTKPPREFVRMWLQLDGLSSYDFNARDEAGGEAAVAPFQTTERKGLRRWDAWRTTPLTGPKQG